MDKRDLLAYNIYRIYIIWMETYAIYVGLIGDPFRLKFI